MIVAFRLASAADAHAVAALHADSWRRHYRIAYSDSYLDGDLLADRLEVWVSRLRDTVAPAETVLVEEDGGLVGFVHVVLEADPAWGALVDNFHVVHTHQRRGIGRLLLCRAAESVVRRSPGSGMHLWVLDENHQGRAFYEALGGEDVECVPAEPPRGEVANLRGSPLKRRIVWRDPAGTVDSHSTR